MLREALACGVLLAPTIALGQPAGPPSSMAQRPEPPPPENDPMFGVVFAPAVGVGILDDTDAIDRALAGGGRAPIEDAAGAAINARFGIEVYGFGLSATLGTIVLGDPDVAGTPSLARDLALAELSYDALPDANFRLGPLLGAGGTFTRLCLEGPATTPGSDDVFAQLVAAPGSETCVEQQQAVFRAGLVAGLAAPIPIDYGASVTLTFDVRPSVTWAVATGDYETLEEEPALAPFEGPTSPRATYELMFDVGFLFGFGER